MYGLVNQAIEDLVTLNFGKEKWEQIREEAKLEVIKFQSLEGYDDKITYDLVGAASKVLELPAEKVLETFGHFWVTYTAQNGYENYLKVGGNTFKQFVLNLNLLHEKIEDVFPQFIPPQFDYEDVTDNSLTLVYMSEREGLAPMLTGLLKGLAEMFKTQLEFEHQPKDDKNKYDKFYLKFS